MEKYLTFHTAIISFCANLVEPGTLNAPIAAISVGRIDDEGAAVLVVPSGLRTLADLIATSNPFGAEVLATLPEAMDLQIQDMLDEHRPKSIDDVIAHLVEMFQNTVHISQVYRNNHETIRVARSNAEEVSAVLQDKLIQHARTAYRRDVKAVLSEYLERQSRPTDQAWPTTRSWRLDVPHAPARRHSSGEACPPAK
jgi:uncharacterized protein (DUF2267 family)